MKTMDCVRAYATSNERHQEVATFCNVTPQTVVRWSEGSSAPQGLALLYARYFFWGKGYLIDEISEKNTGHLLGILISWKVLSFDQVRSGLGLGEGRHHLFRQLLEGRLFSEDREVKVMEFIAPYQPKITEITAAAMGLRSGIAATSKTVVATATTCAPSPAFSCEGGEKKTVLDVLRTLVQSAHPLATHVASDAFNLTERAAFRESFPGNGLHRFVDALTMLLSEQSRANIKQQQQRRTNP
jgi:hypothetical protein